MMDEKSLLKHEEAEEDDDDLSRDGRGWMGYCSRENWKKRLPISSWAASYQPEYLFNDVLSSVVISLTEIPQGLAFAAIAGLPPQYGLYSGILSSIIYGILGSSKDVSIGPQVLVSLLVSNYSIIHVDDNLRHSADFIILLAFCSGIIQIILSFTRLGAIASFISTSVVIGFGNAASLIIIIKQLKFFFGLHFTSTSIFDELWQFFGNLGETNHWDLLVGAVTLLLLLLLTKVSKDAKALRDRREELDLTHWQSICLNILWVISIARIALVIIMMTLIAWIMIDQGYPDAISVVGNVTGGITLQVPQNITNLQAYQAISVAIIVVPLMPFMLDYTVAKKYGRINNYKVDDHQEFLALGVCNVLGSFVSAYPVTASSIRSSIMNEAEVKTGLSSIITGGILFLAVMFFTPIMEFIPTAALAAVVIISLIPHIRLKVYRQIWKVNKMDLIPTLATLICSLLIDVVYGIVIGIAVDLVILLLPIARPHFSMRISYSGENQANAANPFMSPAYIIQVETSVKYPSGDFLAEHLYDMTKSTDYVRPIILDFTHVSRLDITAVEYLGQALKDFHRVGAKLVFAKLQPVVYVQLSSADLDHMILAGSIEEAMDIIAEDVNQS